MAHARFRLRNTSQDPAFPKKGLAGFTLRPEVGGRTLAPRAVRLIARAEITAALLIDIARLREMGLVSFTPEFGSAVEVDVTALAKELGLVLPAPEEARTRDVPPPASTSPDVAPAEKAEPSLEATPQDERVRSEETPPIPGPVTDLAPAPAVAEGESAAPTKDEPSPTEVLDELLADAPSEEAETGVATAIYARPVLEEMPAKDLDRILVEQFGVDPKQLYKIGSKAKKVDEILKLQGARAEE